MGPYTTLFFFFCRNRCTGGSWNDHMVRYDWINLFYENGCFFFCCWCLQEAGQYWHHCRLSPVSSLIMKGAPNFSDHVEKVWNVKWMYFFILGVLQNKLLLCFCFFLIDCLFYMVQKRKSQLQCSECWHKPVRTM